MAKKVKFGKKKPGKKKGGSTAFNFGANVSGKKRNGGFGGGS
ncbi:MAG TPA: hypothetical protein VFW33_16845 [Gemmataceae bacterium]|nr:hypothetical protein [Gemmataceae bacterium]